MIFIRYRGDSYMMSYGYREVMDSTTLLGVSSTQADNVSPFVFDRVASRVIIYFLLYILARSI